MQPHPMNDPFPFPRPHVKFPSGGVTTADLPFPPSLPCLTHLPLPSVSHPHLRQIVCTVLKTAFIHLHAANATRERQCTKARLAVTASGGSRFSLGFVNLSAFSCSPKPNLLFLRLRDSVKPRKILHSFAPVHCLSVGLRSPGTTE